MQGMDHSGSHQGYSGMNMMEMGPGGQQEMHFDGGLGGDPGMMQPGSQGMMRGMGGPHGMHDQMPSHPQHMNGPPGPQHDQMAAWFDSDL